MGTQRTVRLTTAQAIVQFPQAPVQRTGRRSSPSLRVVSASFGHGNVAGMGQALQQYP
ncbi:MAG: hypothetical protein R3A10_07595 [Caldilineaceae bacterium]